MRGLCGFIQGEGAARRRGGGGVGLPPPADRLGEALRVAQYICGVGCVYVAARALKDVLAETPGKRG